MTFRTIAELPSDFRPTLLIGWSGRQGGVENRLCQLWVPGYTDATATPVELLRVGIWVVIPQIESESEFFVLR